MQKNPLTMAGRLSRCWLFAYRTPLRQAQALLPPALEAVSFGGLAYWNIVVCEIRSLRPKSLPALTGIGYRHVAYRLYSQFHGPSGPPQTGLYFLRSDCDSALLTKAGNTLTDFQFHTAGIHFYDRPDGVCLRVDSPDAPAGAAISRRPVRDLSPGSPFYSVEEAAAELAYPPRALSMAEDGQINLVQVRRNEAEWRTSLVHVENARWGYLDGSDAEFELCYEVQPIDYEWTRGTTLPVKADLAAEQRRDSAQLMECGFF